MMKNIKLLVLLPLFIVHISYTATPWYNRILQECYPITCRLIDIAHFTNTKARIAYYKTCNTETLLRHKKHIEKQLNHYKTALLEKEKEILTTIKQTFNISHTDWNECLSKIEYTKKRNKHAMQLSSKKLSCHTQLPKNITQPLFVILQENGINPHAISLKSSPKKHNHIAHVTWNGNVNSNEYRLPKIVFFPRIHELFDDEITAVCAHEVTHIALQHKVVKECIIECIHKSSHLTRKEITEHHAYKALVHIHEAQAEIIPAATKAEYAHCIKQLRSLHFYAHGNLHENHYRQINSINQLWKLHQWIMEKSN